MSTPPTGAGWITPGGSGGPGAVYISVPSCAGGVATGYCATGTNGCKVWYKWTSSGSYTT
jgi:hypothetical protein